MSTTEPGFRFRSIAVSALLPSLLFAIGEGAIIPVIPAIASNLGASLAVAGFIAGMTMIGELIGDIPSGWIVSRIGEQRSMIYAALLSIAAIGVCLVSPNAVVFGAGIFLLGLAAAIFALARHAFMTTYVPVAYRARALSLLGGTFRAGWFVGPFVGAGVIAITGVAQSVFWIQAICGVAIIVTLLVMSDPIQKIERSARPGVPDEGAAFIARESHGLFETLARFRAVLIRLGTGVALVGALRASRMVLLPLWAVSLGLSETTTGIIVGVGGALDFALFYASGQIMDRFGRLWSAVPSMIGLGSSLLVLAFTHELTNSVAWLVVLSITLGISNGVGSGLLMTLGADLAPKADPAPFLGAFRFTGDLGTAAAPVIISGLIAVVSLPAAVGVMGALGFVGAGVLLRYIPRYVPHPGRRIPLPKNS